MARTSSKETIHGAAVKKTVASKRPTSRVITSERQDPDAIFETFKLTPDKYREKYAVNIGSGSKSHISGNFITLALGEDGRIRLEKNYIANTKGLKEFLKTPATRESTLLESNIFGRELLEKYHKNTTAKMRESGAGFSLGLDGNFGANSTAPWPPNNEYIPLMGGPFNKQLYLNDYLAMQAKCFEIKNHNPLAKEIVDIITFFSMGKGVQVKFANPSLAQAWETFEKRNDLQAFLRMDADTLTWGGEIMTHLSKWEDGYPRLRHIDPSTVWEIITDPQDILNVYYYHQQFPTQYQFVYKAGDVAQEYVVNDIPANEVIHMKINVTPGEKRGRSDLFNILGWLKRFKDYYDARITKAQMEESFALKVTVQGSQADVDAYLDDPANNQVPRPGDRLIQNGAVNHEYMTPSASSAGNAVDSIGEAIRGICATGAGLSPEYLGVGGKGSNRANSITKSEPSARKFEDRQTMFKGYIDKIIDYWKVACKELPVTQVRPASLGNLKAAVSQRKWIAVIKEASALMIPGGMVTEPIDWNYQIIFPEIGTEDRTAKLKDIAQSEALQYVSHERAATMSATELGITDYNFEEEQEAIRAWRADRMNDQVFAGDTDPAMELLGKGGLSAAPAGGADGQSSAADGSQASDVAFAAKNQQ